MQPWYLGRPVGSQQPPTTEALAAGELVAGRYEIVRPLGDGGMGTVYEARHRFTGRHVALKLLHRHALDSPGLVPRFLREAHAWTAIRHPGIAEVIDAGTTDDGRPYLALELLEGESLGDRMDREPISPSLAVHVARQVLAALRAAHERGFVHRDVKPDNIFLTGAGDTPGVKLLDFGIAKHDELGKTPLTHSGMVLGTPLYMSPEQALGSAIDGRADLWALGASLYHALGGRPPFDGETYNAVVVAVAMGEYEPLQRVAPHVPPELARVVERALSADPHDRYASAEAMAEALVVSIPSERGAREPLTSVASVERAAVARPFALGRAVAVALALALALALVAAGAWALASVLAPPEDEPRATTPTSPANPSPLRVAPVSSTPMRPDPIVEAPIGADDREPAPRTKKRGEVRMQAARSERTAETPTSSPPPAAGDTDGPSDDAPARVGVDHRSGGLSRGEF